MGKLACIEISRFYFQNPPATAGTILISSPSLIELFIPSKKRTSSPLMYIFTKLRNSLFSSHNLSLIPGNCEFKEFTTSISVEPSDVTFEFPSVYLLNGVGILTSILI